MDLLISAAALAARLGAPGLRVFDCRLTRVAQPSGPSLWLSGRDDWAAGRIPGAQYLHMIDDLSDPASPIPYTLPAPERVAAVLGARGVGEGDTVVLYGAGGDSAAHRAWWVLGASGIDAQVLDGGFAAWVAAGLPVESGPAAPPAPAAPRTAQRADWLADTAAVRAAMEDPAAALVNALPPEFHRGEGAQVFGRRGRIPDSVNLPAEALIDPATGRFRPPEALRALADASLPPKARIIAYCGGGIAASTLALGLRLAGRKAVAVYDGSLLEWTLDPDAPMTVG